MKPFLIHLCVVLVLGIYARTNLGDDTLWTIVAFGDSTTAPRGELLVYPKSLERGLQAEGVDCRVINAGVGGNTTSLGRQRFQNDVLGREPDCVIIQFGINDSAVDVWRNPPADKPRLSLQEYEKNLRFFCRELKARDIYGVLMTPNPLQWTDQLLALYGKPPYQPDDPNGFNLLLARYAAKVREVAEDEGVILIDVDQCFRDYAEKDGNHLRSLLLDGMHPNEAGHAQVTNLLLPEIRRLKP